MKLKLILPLFVAAFAVASEYTGLDLALVKPFYDPASNTWPLRDNFFVSGVMHSFGRDLIAYIMIGVLVLLIGSFIHSRLRRYRKGAAYMLLGGLLGTGIVAVLKNCTHIYSPWDLTIFGADKPYVRLFDAVPEGATVGHAFPGGHSSGGFGLLALYFLLLHYAPRYRFVGLAAGLIVGGAFGAAQEMRGAHFLSHDLFSAVICWYAALGVYYAMYRNEPANAVEAQHETAA